jgi:hypothetical protein
MKAKAKHTEPSKITAYLNIYSRLKYPVEIVSNKKSVVGIVSKPGKRAGYFVLDVDKQWNGHHALKELQKYITFPKTVTAKTQHGGIHYYFLYPKNQTIQTQVNWLPGIDVLSDNSEHIMPPSVGTQTGLRYTWINAPYQIEMASAPKSLLNIINN